MKKLKIIYGCLFLAGLLITLTHICYAQTEIKIPGDSLPGSIKEHLQSKFHDYTVSNAVKKTAPDGTVTYIIDIRRAKNSDQNILYYLVYDSSGKLLDKRKGKEFVYDGKEPVKKTKLPEGDGHNHQH
ncbi:MAG TPA: hypothetical protein VJY62_18380 [Bacteroidia bacterium]|nr:hypothetical protein [Bacteroidia bacterium]